MSDLDKFLAVALKDPEFAEAYKELEPKYRIIEEVIKARNEKGLTQEQLAQKIGSTQRIISRLENGKYNPSLEFLERLASGLDRRLSIQFNK